jgi:alkanesulfonate monooxygenase SsuD/methylene tetrahydromethanopterin reductase-like flavin-dependent oxidoreductase (luciferase family)
MKFHWFAEATYPHLPADFAEKYRSAWVDPPPSLLDPVLGGESLRAYLRMYAYAAQVGFDGVLVNEHHQTAGAMTPSPNLMAAVLAETTSDAAIAIVGNSLALYNPPTRVAEEYAFLDAISGGRLIAGFVYGTPMDSTFAYGTPPAEVRPRFAEAHELILKAWAAKEPFAFNGKYTKLRYVNIWPRPIQQPHPPIWVPGSGSLETWEMVTERDYCYGHLSFSGLQSAKPVVDGYWEYVDKHNGNMNPNRMAFTQLICVSETDASAEAEYREAVEYFYRNTNRVSSGFAQAPGYRSRKSMEWEQAMAEKRGNGRLAAIKGEMGWKEYLEGGYVIAGSPATVRDRLREVVTQLRVGQLIPTLHMGNLSEEQANKNTYLMATEVIPYLKDIWSEYEDLWTPQGLRAAQTRQHEAIAAPAD